MKKFELYHPMMTANYTLDWLNAFTIKEVNRLRANPDVAKTALRSTDLTLEATVDYVQKAMQQVMSNKSLMWGIKKHGQEDFIGEFDLLNYKPDEQTMEIHYELLPEYWRQGIMSEILPRMLIFAFDELDLKYLTASVATNYPVANDQLLSYNFEVAIQTTNVTYYRLYQDKFNDLNLERTCM